MRWLGSMVLVVALAVPSVALAQEASVTVTASGGGGGGRARNWDINQPFTGDLRPFQLDIYGGFSWWGIGFVTGARFGIPIIQNGFIDSINNAVYINFGVDLHFARAECARAGIGGCNEWTYGVGLGFPVTLHWEFFFNETWSAFVELGGQFFLHPQFFRGRPFEVYEAGYWWIAQVGGRLHLGDNFAFHVRVGNPYVAGGITFLF